MRINYDDLFGIEACTRSIESDLKWGYMNIFELLGRYIVRNEQDKFFNTTMIEAAKKYIADHDINWDDEM